MEATVIPARDAEAVLAAEVRVKVFLADAARIGVAAVPLGLPGAVNVLVLRLLLFLDLLLLALVFHLLLFLLLGVLVLLFLVLGLFFLAILLLPLLLLPVFFLGRSFLRGFFFFGLLLGLLLPGPFLVFVLVLLGIGRSAREQGQQCRADEKFHR